MNAQEMPLTDYVGSQQATGSTNSNEYPRDYEKIEVGSEKTDHVTYDLR